MKRKIIMIGIDGGEFSVLRSMIVRGLMPNLKAMMQNGRALDIDTSVQGPGQGWVSLITGRSPESHGIFYWTLYRRPTTSKNIKQDFIWEILGEKGIRSCVMNMSYTYPPRPFNGYIISGLGAGLHLDDVTNISYPTHLLSQIKHNVGDYILACEYKDGPLSQHMKFIRRLIEMTKYRSKACIYMMDNYSPDFTLVVFRGADLIQHCYWNLLHPESYVKQPFEQLKLLIENYYKILDTSIGEIFAKYNDSTNIIISDHGFRQTKAIVNINNYLAQNGFLVKNTNSLAKDPQTISRRLRAGLKYHYNSTLKKYRFFRQINNRRKQIFPQYLARIDINRTKAYSDVLFGLNINKKSLSQREQDRTKTQVLSILDALKDPTDNFPVIDKAYAKEDSYASDLDDAPDIIIEPHENYFVNSGILLNSDHVFEHMHQKPIGFMTGMHRRMGILVVQDNYINSYLNDDDVNITDVFTTVLNKFGVSPPVDTCGRILF